MIVASSSIQQTYVILRDRKFMKYINRMKLTLGEEYLQFCEYAKNSKTAANKIIILIKIL